MSTGEARREDGVESGKAPHKRYWTEGRIIGELHRHGYWWRRG
jgi:hypothetical protein